MSAFATALDTVDEQRGRARPGNSPTPSNTPVFRVLVVDDDPLAVQFVQLALQRPGLEIYGANTGRSALETVRQIDPDLVFLDVFLPDISGMELLERILKIDNQIDVLLLTAHLSTDTAVEAIQKGAYDYVAKPISVEKLTEKVNKWLAEARLRKSFEAADEDLLSAFRFSGIIGRSPAMLEVFSRVRRVAEHFQTVLVSGETGTGKELVSHSLHTLSKRPGPFVTCNCAAIVDTLFESELFGHMRGAFTGAAQDKAGLIEHANGGTLFLDEVGELPLGSQAKLLRVLQNREVQRVGSLSTRKVDVRVVAATNRDLRAMVAAKQFREDLFYRLSMIEIRLPTLLQRRDDLVLFQDHFLKLYASRYGKPVPHLTRRAQTLIARHGWPGNIRELENVLAYCCMLCNGDTIDISDFPEWMQSSQDHAGGNQDLPSMHHMQIRHAAAVLKSTGGNRARAAGILGISRATLYRLLAQSA